MSTITLDTSAAATEQRSLFAIVAALFRRSVNKAPAQGDAWYAVARGM